MYRFVDTLNSSGRSAAVVHSSREFRCTWFDNQTRVVGARDVRLSKGDLVVIPEWYQSVIPLIAPGVAHVIFNQNAYETFTGLKVKPGESNSVVSDDTIGVVVVSEDNRKYVEMCFPTLQVQRVTLGIDTKLFAETIEGKTKSIAYMPRKRHKELNQILHILNQRQSLEGWELTPIEGLSEVETARVLSRAAIFLSLNEREGFGLPSLEAMASGCVVVGFHGGAGIEYMRPEATIPIADGEIRDFVVALESVLLRWGTDASLEDMSRNAVEIVRREYSQRSEDHDVVTVFGGALESVAELAPGQNSLNYDLLRARGRGIKRFAKKLMVASGVSGHR
jgi:hypothetical protein